MNTPGITRRRAITLFGAAGAGLVLGGCGGSGDGDAEANGGQTSTTAQSASSTTVQTGSSTTAQTSSGPTATASMFANANSCALTPEQTEGPYYIDVDRVRADIREDRQGTELRVAVRVVDVDGCTPVRDAVFEIWHCDASGLYSGFESASRGGGSTSDDSRYLRGAQTTNADGIAEITTVYPGWYRGRTVHIHAKVHLSNTEVLTTQLYFDEEVTEAVYASPPYTAHSGRDAFNSNDGIFSQKTVLSVSKDGAAYVGLITLGVSA